MVFILDDENIGREWVNSPKAYPIQSFGVLRNLPDGELEFDKTLYKTIGLMVESKNTTVLVVVYKNSMKEDFFKYIVKPGQRRWVIFPGGWHVNIQKLGDKQNAVYDLWAETL